MPKFEFDDMLIWPNFDGSTPCTKAYAETMAARDAIKNKPEYDDIRGADGWLPIDDMTAEDYEAWCRLDAQLGSMQIEGQVGMGERWAA